MMIPISKVAGTCALAFALLSTTALSQIAGSQVSGVRGVKQDAVQSVKPMPPVKPVEPTATAPDISKAQGIGKVDGIETIQGVKASVPPPPPASVTQSAAAVTQAGSSSIGAAGSIRAINGVTGINTARLKNLEAALILKTDANNTPAGGGAERGGKGKAAAAALLSAPLDKVPQKIGPKEDGRAGFQEFEKLQNRGS